MFDSCSVEALHRTWEILASELVMQQVIGRGSYGVVYTGKLLSDSVQVLVLDQLVLMRQGVGTTLRWQSSS